MQLAECMSGVMKKRSGSLDKAICLIGKRELVYSWNHYFGQGNWCVLSKDRYNIYLEVIWSFCQGQPKDLHTN